MTTTQRPRLEKTTSGAPLLRIDDVFLVRGRSGAWLLDFTAVVAGRSKQVAVHIGRRRDLDLLVVELRGLNAK